jgi:hypothetical protein
MTVATLTPWIRPILGILRRLGPYAAIEIILPGGSVVVLLLWLYRQHGGGCSISRSMRTWLLRQRRRAAPFKVFPSKGKITIHHCGNPGGPRSPSPVVGWPA